MAPEYSNEIVVKIISSETATNGLDCAWRVPGLFQNVGRFDFLDTLVFYMYLDITSI